MKRRKYSQQLKDQLIAEVQGGAEITAVAKAHRVDYHLLHRWVTNAGVIVPTQTQQTMRSTASASTQQQLAPKSFVRGAGNGGQRTARATGAGRTKERLFTATEVENIILCRTKIGILQSEIELWQQRLQEVEQQQRQQQARQ